jgi:hypothetical protein
MTDMADYVAQVELAWLSSPIVAEYQIVRFWANTDDGYMRIRATLVNGDFLEAAEYFVLDRGQVVTTDYRHQWMASDKQTLRRRWDSTPHHPELASFPHHEHVHSEETVASGRPVSLTELLDKLSQLLSKPPT